MSIVLHVHVHVSVSFAKYGTLTTLTIFGHKKRAHEVLVSGRQELACPLSVMIFFPSFMDLYGHCLRTITSVDVRN